MTRKVFVDVGASVVVDGQTVKYQTCILLDLSSELSCDISVQAPYCIFPASAPLLALFISSSFSEGICSFWLPASLLMKGPLPGMPFPPPVSPSPPVLSARSSLPSSGPVSNRTILVLSELSLLKLIIINKLIKHAVCHVIHMWMGLVHPCNTLCK